MIKQSSDAFEMSEQKKNQPKNQSNKTGGLTGGLWEVLGEVLPIHPAPYGWFCIAHELGRASFQGSISPTLEGGSKRRVQLLYV